MGQRACPRTLSSGSNRQKSVHVPSLSSTRATTLQPTCYGWQWPPDLIPFSTPCGHNSKKSFIPLRFCGQFDAQYMPCKAPKPWAQWVSLPILDQKSPEAVDLEEDLEPLLYLDDHNPGGGR